MKTRPTSRAAKIGLFVAERRVALAASERLREVGFYALYLIEPPAMLLIL